MRKLANIVGKVLGLICVASACCVDSDTWIPFIIFCVSGILLTWYSYEKGYFYSEEEYEYDEDETEHPKITPISKYQNPF